MKVYKANINNIIEYYFILLCYEIVINLKRNQIHASNGDCFDFEKTEILF